MAYRGYCGELFKELAKASELNNKAAQQRCLTCSSRQKRCAFPRLSWRNKRTEKLKPATPACRRVSQLFSIRQLLLTICNICHNYKVVYGILFRSWPLLTITNLQCLQQPQSWQVASFFFFFFFVLSQTNEATLPHPTPIWKTLSWETKCELLRWPLKSLKVFVHTTQCKKKDVDRTHSSKLTHSFQLPGKYVTRQDAQKKINLKTLWMPRQREAQPRIVVRKQQKGQNVPVRWNVKRGCSLYWKAHQEFGRVSHNVKSVTQFKRQKD